MKHDHQVAALPLKRAADGSTKVLLVTSRQTHRWVVPKGWPFPDRADHLAAAEEAWEEAGVRGTADPRLLGTFTYEKRRRNGSVNLTVAVYALLVTEELATWPESRERERDWFDLHEAAAAVEETELKRILLSLI